MGSDKTISMSDLRKVVDQHLRSLRCTELTRAFLRKEFKKLLDKVDGELPEEKSRKKR